jgi:5-deoxy-D-glucuronate isomerase
MWRAREASTCSSCGAYVTNHLGRKEAIAPHRPGRRDKDSFPCGHDDNQSINQSIARYRTRPPTAFATAAAGSWLVESVGTRNRHRSSSPPHGEDKDVRPR